MEIFFETTQKPEDIKKVEREVCLDIDFFPDRSALTEDQEKDINAIYAKYGKKKGGQKKIENVTVIEEKKETVQEKKEETISEVQQEQEQPVEEEEQIQENEQPVEQEEEQQE